MTHPGQPQPPLPRIHPNAVLAAGFAAYLLASAWPPLLLAVTYVLYMFVPYAWRVNDDGDSRRRLWREFEDRARDDVDCKEWKELLFPKDDVVLTERYWVNKRGMCLSTSTMVPRDSEVKAVVCFCHGYMDNASFVKRYEYQRLVRARSNIAVVTIEYEGHGRSDGPNAYIPDWTKVIDDASGYFREITRQRFPGKPCFLMGESMGAAVVFDTYRRCPEMWKGTIFVSPMCKIADEMLPPNWVIEAFKKVLGPAGTERRCGLGALPLAPAAGDVSDLSFKLESKKFRAQHAPSAFGRQPRLATARELLLTTARISESLKTFDAPFIVLHGLADKVTDPALSRGLYEESTSTDKEIKLYPGMWHTLTSGEPSENIDLVFQDVISWIEARI